MDGYRFEDKVKVFAISPVKKIHDSVMYLNALRRYELHYTVNLMNRIHRLSLLAICVLALAWSTHSQITVAVAANVKFAMEELKTEFKKSTGVDVKTIYGASGKFCTQIKNGAPFDIFISADMSFPDSVYRWGYAKEKPKTYAYGNLVLWTLKDFNLDKGLSVLADSGVARIAVASPKQAPYGHEAVRALKKAGLYDKVESRLVYGENISQVTQFLITGNVDFALNAKSVVLADEMAGKGRWKEVDSALYAPIAQGAVICKYGRKNNPSLSQRFYDFLYSDTARAIFLRYGYRLP